MAMENCPFIGDVPNRMVSFHSYLPEVSICCMIVVRLVLVSLDYADFPLAKPLEM